MTGHAIMFHHFQVSHIKGQGSASEFELGLSYLNKTITLFRATSIRSAAIKHTREVRCLPVF